MMRVLLRGFVRSALKPVLGPRVSVKFQRRWLHGLALTLPAPRGTRRQPIRMDGVAGERVGRDDTASDRVVLYLHGGGYCVGTPYGFRAITGHLARHAEAVVYAPDYRLAPEHPHPAALNDALCAYRWLLAQHFAPQSIAFAGDSAGGGLALATAIAARDSGLPLPATLALISPWVDLAGRGETMTTHVARDPMLAPAGLARWGAAYLGGRAADDPACSPLFADLRGLPPMLLQVGSEEILLSDARRLAERARAAGVEVTLREFEGLWHDFHLHAGMLKDSTAALIEMAQFLRGGHP